jgi:hypothetical protein
VSLRLLALSLCMFCGMSFLSANEEAEEQDIEVTEEEVAAADEIVNLEKVEKTKKTQDCGCK